MEHESGLLSWHNLSFFLLQKLFAFGNPSVGLDFRGNLPLHRQGPKRSHLPKGKPKRMAPHRRGAELRKPQPPHRRPTRKPKAPHRRGNEIRKPKAPHRRKPKAPHGRPASPHRQPKRSRTPKRMPKPEAMAVSAMLEKIPTRRIRVVWRANYNPALCFAMTVDRSGGIKR